MKKLLLTTLLIVPVLLFGQEWIKNLPQEKAKNGELTFFEIQKSFNDYYDPLGVVNGKIEVKGKLEKVPGWKQFKRWEWFWESRVNPETGEFPSGDLFDNSFKQQTLKGTKTTIGNWTAMGPSASDGGYAGVGRINCIAFHPTDKNTFWVGSPSGGLWKTTDNGVTWTVLTDANAVLGVSDIVIPLDYVTSKTIYIATGDKDGGSMWSLGGGGRTDNASIGVLKTTDDGVTWNATGLTYTVSQKMRIGRLLIHPTNNNILFAATSDGIKKSTNGGTDWSTVYAYTRQYYGDAINDMEFKPGNPDIMFASTKEYGSPKILKSSNTGSTWETIKSFSTSDYRVEIAVTPDDAEYIYAIVANTNSGLSGIYRSQNGGTSFVQLIDGDDTDKAFLGYYSDGSGGNSGQGGYDLCIAASPGDKNVVLIGGVNSWKTTDGGVNWSICNMWTSYSGYNMSGAPEVHADKHTLVFRSDTTLFEGNDGGVYQSYNDGSTWTDLTNGLVISQIYRMGVSQTDNNMVINGLQDNGSKLVDESTWTDVTGGDGMECIIDNTNKNTQYSTYVRGEIYRTTNGWGSYTTISDNISVNSPGEGSGAWVTPYIMDKNDNSTLYVGYADVWKTTNKGDAFAKISTMNSSDDLRSMAIAPSNSSYLYVADFSHIWQTTNGGTSWTDITGTLPVSNNNITYIAVKHNDPLTVWITMGGYNNERVYETTNGGTNWTNISTGLPELPVMSIVQNSLVTSVNHIYVGTDVGVYFKNGTENWVLFSQGLPNVVVTELEIYYEGSNSKLRAATFGRGLWESDLYEEPAIAPVTDFAASATTIVTGQTITFTDASQNSPTSWAWVFSGGTPGTSEEQNPQVTFNTTGTFDVVLTATNEIGSDTETKTGYITVNLPAKPVAEFSANSTSVYIGQPVVFTDASTNTPTSWDWSFPSGNPISSTDQNPSVIYAQAGTYDVSLTVTNSGGTDSETKTSYITVEETIAFPEPINVTASALKHDVTITWEKPITQIIIDEGFEGTWPPADWTVQHSSTIDGVQSDPTGATWFQCSESSFEGEGLTYINSGMKSAALGYTAPEFNWLITPEIYIEASTELSFYIWYFSKTSDNFITKFHVLVNDAGTWSSLLDYGDGTANNEYATPVELSLAAYSDKIVQIAFVYEYNDGYQLAIDDVFIGTIADGYKMYRDSVLVSTIIDSETLEYKDFGLDAGDYDYFIKTYYEDPNGESEGSNKASVTVNGIANAQFSATPVGGSLPLDVTFTNLSENATTYSWDFGDSNTSVEESPTHTYSEVGTYSVSLTSSNPENSDTETKTSYVNVTMLPVTAGFTVDKNSGPFPLKVIFTNTSENAVNYKWLFGDGNTSLVESPEHTYVVAGDYTVELIASNTDFTDTLIKANYISVAWPAPVAKFVASPTTGIDPLMVEFTDSSKNAQTWRWNFGDGETSIDQNPSHIFTKGAYSIELLVTNPSGNNSITKNNLIIVDPNSLPENYKHKLKVYPNPVKDVLLVELLNENYKDVEIELYDTQGKLLEIVNPDLNELVRHNFDFSNLDAGNYVLRIKIDSDILVLSIVKE